MTDRPKPPSGWIESDVMAPAWKLVDMTYNRDVMAFERDEALAKVDQLYRALARGHNIRRDSQRMYQCDVCGIRWHRGKTSHADGCLSVEAVEYVANNPKEEQ